MPAGDLIKLVVNTTLYSENIQNVLYYKVITDDNTNPNEEALATEFSNEILPGWTSAVVQAVDFTCLQTQKVFPQPAASTFDFFIASAGTIVGQGLPATDAALIRKFNPAVGGIGRKGRVYIAGVPEAEANLGRISLSYKSQLESLALEMIQVINSPNSGQYLPVWAVKDKLPPFDIDDSVDWTNFTVMPRIATQRRRRTPIVSFSTP